MPMTPDQEQELEENGMGNGTIGRFYYNEMINEGLSHRDAIRNYVDGLNNMQSTTFTPEQLRILKSIMERVKGQMF